TPDVGTALQGGAEPLARVPDAEVRPREEPANDPPSPSRAGVPDRTAGPAGAAASGPGGGAPAPPVPPVRPAATRRDSAGVTILEYALAELHVARSIPPDTTVQLVIGTEVGPPGAVLNRVRAVAGRHDGW